MIMKLTKKLLIGILCAITMLTVSSCAFLDFLLSDELYTVTYENYDIGQKPSNLEEVIELPDELPQLKQKGYEFLGWYYDETFILEALPNDLIIKDTTLYACWAKEYYTLKFNNNGKGESISSIKEIYKIPELPQLEQEGFSFVGWYYDANFNTPAKKDDEIFADTTLYAKWEVSNVTVNIYSYISCVPEVMEVPYGQPIEVPGAPNREGYEFVCWNTKSDGTGKSYKPGDKITEIPISKYIDLYSIWKQKEYVLTYNLNNGQQNVVKAVKYGEKITKIEDPVKEGHKFIGWYYLGEAFNFDDAKMPSKNIALEAKYLKEVNITFISFGETYKTIQGYETKEINENITNLSKEGYTFGGWYLDQEFKQEYNLKTFPDEDVNVYAKWEIIEYTVTFNLDNNEEDIVKTLHYGDLISQITNPVKEGYKFVGWYLNDQAVDLNNTHMPSKNIIITAKYLKQIEIIFISSNEIVDKLVGYETEEIVGNVNVPTREGYSFEGWYLDAECTQEYNLTKFQSDNVKVYAKWSPIEYKISFIAEEELIKELTAVYNQDIFAVDCDIQKQGHEFVGWNTKQDGTGKTYLINESLKNISTTNIQLYATWKQLEYTLTIKLNNGESDIVKTLHYNDSIETIDVPVKEHSEFIGWFTYDNNQVVEFNFEDSKMPADNMVVFAKYSGEVNLIFIVDNKPYQTIIGFENNDINELVNNPTKEGYKFKGWYLDSEYSQEYNLVKFPNKDTNVYGKWEANTIVVDYNGNGNTEGTMESQTIVYGSNTPLNKNEFVKKGSEFLGWALDANSLEVVYHDQYNKEVASIGSVTLYAVWKQIEYTLTINLNNSEENIIKKLYYNELIEEIENPNKSGYIFKGWYLEDGQEFNFEDSKMPDSNLIIYAEYLKGVEILFISEGKLIDKVSGYETLEITGTIQTITKTGHTFKGWYLDTDFKQEYNLEKFPGQNTNVYAKWEVNTVIIKFNGNGNTSGNMSSQSVVYNSGTALNENEFVKTGYEFIGWSTDKDATEEMYCDGYNKDIIAEGEITLYAVWKQTTYTVTFDNNDHGQTPAQIKGVVKLPSTLPILIEEGYIFIGWYYDEDFKHEAKVNDVITDNVLLYAKWEVENVEPTPTPTEPIVDDIIYDDLQIHFLELGNDYTGDSTYIKAGDNDILIDAGSRKNSAETIKKYVDQYCTDGVLEYVIATHADQDHIAGFVGNSSGSTRTGILYQYEVETIIDFARSDKTTQIYKDYQTARTNAINKGAKHYTAAECFNNEGEAKSTYDLGNGIELTILYNYYYFNKSSDENNYSVCTLLTYNEHHFMFTGDLEKDGEEKLASYYNGSTPAKTLPKVDLFKAGHHGSKTSSNDCLLKLIEPKIVCVCCCAGGSEYTNQYKNTFPTQDMINRVAKYTDRVYVTTYYDEKATTYKSLNGNIIISSNGNTIGVSASNNITKLKDSKWFNETIYVKSGIYHCSEAGKKDYYTSATSGTSAVPRRVWPS